MKRGQVALEFIMTYGWAILAVLAAITALAYFGVLSPSKYLPEKCLFETGIGCKDFQFSNTGTNDLTVRFTITNDLGDGIIVGTNNVTAVYRATNVPCGPASTTTISSGADQAFTCVFTGLSPGKGQNTKVNVNMNYTLAQGVYAKQAQGEFSGTVQ